MLHVGFEQRKQHLIAFVKVNLDLPGRSHGEESLTDGRCQRAHPRPGIQQPEAFGNPREEPSHEAANTGRGEDLPFFLPSSTDVAASCRSWRAAE